MHCNQAGDDQGVTAAFICCFVVQISSMGQFTNLTAIDGFVFSAYGNLKSAPKAAVVRYLQRFWR
jgi:hypothetical protein